ncbi:MAG: hypothetical protein M3342_23215 [Bacteroidota bacterium]|nr:hypothetical protein [Bacteroidota bacterium]
MLNLAVAQHCSCCRMTERSGSPGVSGLLISFVLERAKRRGSAASEGRGGEWDAAIAYLRGILSRSRRGGMPTLL